MNTENKKKLRKNETKLKVDGYHAGSAMDKCIV